ncbi:hypothetical protein PS2_008542 [Malus domestica]
MVHSIMMRGKIVVCIMDKIDDDVMEKAKVVKEGGAVGMIIIDQFDNFNEHLPSFDLPTSVISSMEGRKLSDYMATIRRRIASILETREVIGVELAPTIALFSSRGPNSVTPDIIKPDITAPGVNILAAAPPSKNQAVDALSYNMHSAKTKDNNGNTIRDRSGKTEAAP